LTDDEQIVLMIRGAITQLPADAQKIVAQHYDSMSESVKQEPLAAFAVALLGAELAAK
jgi:hypothetical protein